MNETKHNLIIVMKKLPHGSAHHVDTIKLFIAQR